MSGACGMVRRPSPDPCDIRAEIKNRNGTDRWWCNTHGAPAWDSGGGALLQCAGAGGALPEEENVLVLDPEKFPGGVGIWGAVNPVYAWGPDTSEHGVHVHARRFPGGPKEIDRTYQEVVLLAGDARHPVDAEAAVNVVFSRVIGVPLASLRCRWCSRVHLDAAEFAIEPHRRHQCNWCGRFFWADTASVSNPCEELQMLTGIERQGVVPSSAVIELEQNELGGLAIWGSNQAVSLDCPRL
jgi:hypothetical protein